MSGLLLIGVRSIGNESKYPETGPLVDGMPSESKSINHAFVGDLGYFMHHRAKVHNALGLCSVLGTFTVSNSARFLTFTVCLIRCRSTAGWVGLALSRNFAFSSPINLRRWSSFYSILKRILQVSSKAS